MTDSPLSCHAGLDVELCVPYVCEMQEDVCGLLADDSYTVVDVRAVEDYESLGLPCAINFPRLELEDALESGAFQEAVPDFDTSLLVHCTLGYWAAQSKDLLEEAGYTNVVNLGGYQQIADLGCSCRNTGIITKHYETICLLFEI